MRHVAALLLLLVPGLLLPAGLWLQVCRCEAMATRPRACCHASNAAPAPAHPTRTCCQHRQGHDAPIPGDPAAHGDDCGCTWEPLGTTPEPTIPPPTCQRPPVLFSPPAFAPLPPLRVSTTAVGRPATPQLRAPPPPHAQRNLPLRL